MKIIIACMKLYNDKDHHTNGNTNSQSGDVDNSVIPFTDQTSECGFKIILKHKIDFEILKLRDWEIAIPKISQFYFSPIDIIPFSNSLRAVAYSVRRLFTGFATAALIAWKLIVANAINTDANAESANTHHDILTL